MRVVFISETFSETMGYIGSMLPKSMAKLGVDVHVVTTNLLPYYQTKDFERTYSALIKKEDQNNDETIQEFDGYKIHRLRYKKSLGYTRLLGLKKKLEELNPDVVQTFASVGWIPLDASLLKTYLKYKLFVTNHTTASVFPLAQQKKRWWHKDYLKNFLVRWLPGRLASFSSEKCYVATPDCADIAFRFLGIQKSKINICPLGVDTDIFGPCQSFEELQERARWRKKFGFSESDIVCIYTGRFSTDKNPALLAQAIEQLTAKGEPFKGLFVGNGVQEEEIRNTAGCQVHPFVNVKELNKFFWMADIGVWPTQESTSMLDAAASGIPVIVNNTVKATERFEGNGTTYRLNDLESLVLCIQSLKDASLRKQLGTCGAEKMLNRYSWLEIAKQRLDDYEHALQN